MRGITVVDGARVVSGPVVVACRWVVIDGVAVLRYEDPQADISTPMASTAADTIRTRLGVIGWCVVLPHGHYRRPSRWTCLVLVVPLLVSGCDSGTGRTVSTAAHRSQSSATTAPRASSTTTTTASTTTTSVPAFTSSVSLVSEAQLGGTWHAGCPVDSDQLRLLEMSYWGFDDQPHLGTMVVNVSVADSVIEVFSTLYADRFPIEEMVPESAYGGDDNTAAAADDTSGFNCRYAVASGPPQWSMHAYGEAIDVNDVQNPYIEGTTIIPPAGAVYQDRSDVRPGMAVLGGTLVDAFASVGWQWGGRWTGSPDYQHFSLNGE